MWFIDPWVKLLGWTMYAFSLLDIAYLVSKVLVPIYVYFSSVEEFPSLRLIDPKSFQVERKGLPTKEQESGQHQWQKSSSTAFKFWKENHSEPQILYVAKLSFKWEGKNKDTSRHSNP